MQDCDSTDLLVEQNLDEKKDINISIGNESSDSESETPEEVSFAKSKEVFMEESDAIRFLFYNISFLLLRNLLTQFVIPSAVYFLWNKLSSKFNSCYQ